MDITQRRHYEEELERSAGEKAALLRELQHREKNSFAMISALIKLQSDRMDSKEMKSTLEDLLGRIDSLGNLYEMLYRSGETTRVRMDEYFGGMIDSLERMYLSAVKRIAVVRSIEPFEMGVKHASYMGLILNELLTNALKYAFPGELAGSVEVRLEARGDRFDLMVTDDGTGLPHGFNPERSPGFGFTIIRMLTEQMGGSFSIERVARTGFRVSVPAGSGK